MNTINKTFALISSFIVISCGTSKPIVSQGGLDNDECPYQRFKFIGSSKVESTKGIEVLNKLSAALELEKNQILKSGNVNDSLKIQVSNIMKETGNFEIPISKDMATEYTQLANSICTLRRDLYSEKTIFSPQQREMAAKQYLELLSYVGTLKKKLE